ncbi:MAG TPA: DUF1161 domain-containing protein [Burkholderiaceae bacterium]|jgi:predicted phage gp36 major capsid-like protein
MKIIRTVAISWAIMPLAFLSATAYAQTPSTSASAKADTQAVVPAAAPATGGRLACDELKQAIAAKLAAHGVKQYTLEIVDAAQTSDGKIVGQCDGGKSKLVYTKGAGPAAPSK